MDSSTALHRCPHLHERPQDQDMKRSHPSAPGPLPLRASPRGNRDPTASVVRVFMLTAGPKGRGAPHQGGPSWATSSDLPCPSEVADGGTPCPPTLCHACGLHQTRCRREGEGQTGALPARRKTVVLGAPSTPWFPHRLWPPLPLLEGGQDPQRHLLAPGPQRARSAAVAGEGLLGLHPTASSWDLPRRRLGRGLWSGFQLPLGYVGFWAGSVPPVSKRGLGWTHRSEARRTLHREGLRSAVGAPAVGGQRLLGASGRHRADTPPPGRGGKGRGQCGLQGKGQGPCTQVPLGRRRRTLRTDEVWK